MEHKYHYNDYSCFDDLGDVVAVDLETTGLSIPKCEICYLSLCFKENEAWVFSWPMKTGSLAWLWDIDILKVFHHAKFDMGFLEKAGLVVNNFNDTKLMAYHYDNRLSGRQSSLKWLAMNKLGIEEPTEFKDLFPRRQQKDKTVLDVDIEKLIPYAGDDAIYTLALYNYFQNEIADLEYDEEQTLRQNLGLDLRCSSILQDIMANGCKIDTSKLLQMQTSCMVKIAEVQRQLSKWVPETTNIGSSKQLQELLYTEWKLPVMEFTKSGAFSTDDDTLGLLDSKHPAISLLRQYREYKKILSTYLEPFASMTKDDGFLYGGFNQTRTITGRLSSSEPNLQNIPSRSDFGKTIRNCWVSRFDGGKIMVADHSQIEMRIMAHFSQDARLIKDIIDGKDLHAATAEAIFGSSNSETRSVGKTINFGTIYGMGAKKLALSLGITVGQAQEYLRAYFDAYPGVKQYLHSQMAFVEKTGYVETLLGRRLYIHEYDYAGTRAVNYPIQGSAAEVLKIGMVNVAKFIISQGKRAKLILQVHDELVTDVPPEDVQVYESSMEPVMLEGVPKLRVPLEVSVGVGDSWGEAK